MRSKNWMKTIPDESTCIFGSSVLLKHLKALIGEVDGVREARDIEYIHRTRVASRRLRSALTIFKDSYPQKTILDWQDDIKKITKALGAARDVDVQVDCLRKIDSGLSQKQYRSGIRRILLRLNQQRTKLQTHVITTLDNLEKKHTLERMYLSLNDIVGDKNITEINYTNNIYKQAQAIILTRLESFLSFNEYLFQPELMKELHEMRISAKSFRYAMENLSSLYNEQLMKPIEIVRGFQEILGKIHDCDVWGLFLPRFMEDERRRVVKYCGQAGPFTSMIPGILFFRDNRKSERDRLYRKFTTEWQRIENQPWNAIKEIIISPLTR